MLQALPAEIRALRALGAGYVEFPGDICLVSDPYSSQDVWSEAARILRSEGLGATVHLPFAWVDLTSLDCEVWEGSLRSVEAAMTALTPLEPVMASVHPANYATQAVLLATPETARPGLMQAFGQRLVPALQRLRRGVLGPVLALENLEGMPIGLFRFLVEAADVRVCLDIGHAVAEGQDPAALFGEMKGRVLGLHLHDGVPETGHGAEEERAHKPLGEGVLDLDGLVRVLLESGFGGPVVLEILGEDEPSARAFRAVLGRDRDRGHEAET